MRKGAPSGDNNEQFRDCCIWETALQKAADRVVHLVSADRAFYDNRSPAPGPARELHLESAASKNGVVLCPGLKEFLAATDLSAPPIDEIAIGDEIIRAIMGEAEENAAGMGRRFGVPFEIIRVHRPKLSGHATPKPSLVAISFEVAFDLARTVVEAETQARDEAEMTLKGVCSYDPMTRDVSEIETRGMVGSIKARFNVQSRQGLRRLRTIAP